MQNPWSQQKGITPGRRFAARLVALVRRPKPEWSPLAEVLAALRSMSPTNERHRP